MSVLIIVPPYTVISPVELFNIPVLPDNCPPYTFISPSPSFNIPSLVELTVPLIISTVPVMIDYNDDESFIQRTDTLTKNQKNMCIKLYY